MSTFTRTYANTLERIIAEEVLANASTLVDSLLKDESGQYLDDLMPCCRAPDYDDGPAGYSIVAAFHGFGWIQDDDTSNADGPFDTRRDAIIAAWEDSGDEPDDIEALQHWIISPWLADKLESIGALVARDVMGFDIWGRTDCGQALALNHDLKAVAAQIDAA